MVSMAPTCFGTVIDVPGAIRDAGRAMRGGPFDLTSGTLDTLVANHCAQQINSGFEHFLIAPTPKIRNNFLQLTHLGIPTGDAILNFPPSGRLCRCSWTRSPKRAWSGKFKEWHVSWRHLLCQFAKKCSSMTVQTVLAGVAALTFADVREKAGIYMLQGHALRRADGH